MATKKEQAATTPATTPPPAPAALAQATALVRTGVSLPQASAVNDYALVAMINNSGGDLAEAMQENLGGASLGTFDFERIKVPSGKSIAWQYVDADTGKPKITETIEGIVVAWNDQKAYWKQSLDEQGAVSGPPQCFSVDTVRGIGDPGVACETCKFNKFGSAKNDTGRGKACKDWRAIFVIRPGDILPILIPIPPTSIKNVKQYFINLAGRGIPYYRAVTQFNLSLDKNANGIEYAKVVCTAAGVVPDNLFAGIKGFHKQIKQQLSKAVVNPTADDLGSGERQTNSTESFDPVTGEVISNSDTGDRSSAVV